jgi:hypothetical protein
MGLVKSEDNQDLDLEWVALIKARDQWGLRKKTCVKFFCAFRKVIRMTLKKRLFNNK